MEAQVLSGILPISRVSFVPSCIHYLSRLLPLETIFELEHPRTNEVPKQPKEDKRTWRGERAKEEQVGIVGEETDKKDEEIFEEIKTPQPPHFLPPTESKNRTSIYLGTNNDRCRLSYFILNPNHKFDLKGVKCMTEVVQSSSVDFKIQGSEETN